jgi:hypothetical protein
MQKLISAFRFSISDYRTTARMAHGRLDKPAVPSAPLMLPKKT